MLFLSQNGPIGGGQPPPPVQQQQHFLLHPTTTHSPGTIVIIEELETHQGRPLGHFGDLMGSDGPGTHQSPSPTGLSSASTAMAFDWLDGPGERIDQGNTNPVNYLRAPAYFDQTAGGGGNPQAAAAIYGNAGGTIPYYQHYQPSSLAPSHQQLHHGHSQQQQQPVQLHLQSAPGGSPPTLPTTFVLRQTAPHQKSLSPDISVDEEAGDGQQGGGGGGQGHQQQQAAHTARTPPETLEWLQANYEEFKGASLPRCTLYEHYQNHCREAGLLPVNAASFGKLIRSVFTSLATRRLGTRGNSKYHYNGIRVKPNSHLAATMSQEEFQRMNSSGGGHQQQQATKPGGTGGGQQRGQRRQSTAIGGGGQRRTSRVGGGGARGGGANSSAANSSSDEQQQQGAGDQAGRQSSRGEQEQMVGQQSPSYAADGHQVPPLMDGATGGHHVSPAHGATANRTTTGGNFSLPEVKLPSLDEAALLQFGLGVEHALKFFDDYREHCRKVLDCVKQCRLELVEGLWATFWQGNADGDGGEKNGEEQHDGELGQLRGAPALDQSTLFRLCSLPQVVTFVECFDLKFYQLLLDLLFPVPLRLSLPGDLCNRVRHFAKSVRCWMEKALGPRAPLALRRAKLGTVRLLSNSLTRLSSVAHLAITARNVLQNEQQVEQMHEDFCRVDFAVVHWQADWLCLDSHCPPDGASWIRELVSQFRDRLARRCSLEEWADWLEGVAERALAGRAGQSPEAQLAQGKRFLQGWTVHSSLLLRDITLRSAQSFGQFHLVRLLFDDYLSLAMEQKLAKLTGQDPIALMMAPEVGSNTFQIGSPVCSTARNLLTQPPQQQFGMPPLRPVHPPPPPQHFYSQRQHSNQYQMVDQLPPPGPEPPLDMLNGTGEEQQQHGRGGGRGTREGGGGRGRRGEGGGQLTIQYVMIHQREQQQQHGREGKEEVEDTGGEGAGRMDDNEDGPEDDWEMVEEREAGGEHDDAVDVVEEKRRRMKMEVEDSEEGERAAGGMQTMNAGRK